jgi:hypothetical protein
MLCDADLPGERPLLPPTGSMFRRRGGLVAVPGGSVADVPGSVTGSSPMPSSMTSVCPASCRGTGLLSAPRVKARAAARGRDPRAGRPGRP